jgi:Na+-driven multidrug efflux pump
MAIVARLTPVAFGVIFALSGAIGPIIGQNFGRGGGPRCAAPIATGCCSRRSSWCRSA